ncbi:MAG: hypothetical protein L6R39_007576, partial [Caloplaca ligustica]
MTMPSKDVYVDEELGIDDTSADGSQQKPYKTLLFAHVQHPPSDGLQYLTRKKEAGADQGPGVSEVHQKWVPATQSALKKAGKAYEQHKRKQAKGDELAIREKQEADKRQQALEEAKAKQIHQDPKLPKAVKIRLNEKDPALIKLRSGESKKDVDYSEGRGTRVRVTGRVHRLRTQKDVIFLTLQDGYGLLQCVLTGDLTKTYDALTMTLETSLEIYGEMWEVPPGQHAPDDRELHADFYTVIGKAAGDKEAITTRVSPDADPQTLYDNRHLVLRGENASSVMKVRAAVLRAFRQTYEEISPTCLE